MGVVYCTVLYFIVRNVRGKERCRERRGFVRLGLKYEGQPYCGESVVALSSCSIVREDRLTLIRYMEEAEESPLD